MKYHVSITRLLLPLSTLSSLPKRLTPKGAQGGGVPGPGVQAIGGPQLQLPTTSHSVPPAGGVRCTIGDSFEGRECAARSGNSSRDVAYRCVTSG